MAMPVPVVRPVLNPLTIDQLDLDNVCFCVSGSLRSQYLQYAILSSDPVREHRAAHVFQRR